MKTSHRPELQGPVTRFWTRLREARGPIPLTELAALFGAGPEVLDRVARRGDLVFRGEVFTNDGPELVIPAGQVEVEIPSLLRGTWTADDTGFALEFPSADYTLRACAQIAFFRKTFDLKAMRATASDLVLDFGGSMADRRYTFGAACSPD
jgi:hypothetical protein